MGAETKASDWGPLTVPQKIHTASSATNFVKVNPEFFKTWASADCELQKGMRGIPMAPILLEWEKFLPLPPRSCMPSLNTPLHEFKIHNAYTTTRSQTPTLYTQQHSSYLLTYSPQVSLWHLDILEACAPRRENLWDTQTHLCNAIPCHKYATSGFRIVVWELESAMVELSVERMQLGCSERTTVNPSPIQGMVVHLLRSFHHAHTSFDTICIWCGAPP